MRIAAIVLAAGASRRFGPADKLMADINGVPLLSMVLQRFNRDIFAETIVVIDPTNAPVKTLVANHGCQIAENETAKDGMGGSIAAGVRKFVTADLMAR